MSAEDWEPVEIEDVRGLSLTDGGALWCVTADGTRFCIPEKVIHENSEVFEPGTEGTLIIPRKFAKEKGLV